MTFEIIRGLQVAAMLAILIWLKDRIEFRRRFGVSVAALTATFVMPAVVVAFGSGWGIDRTGNALFWFLLSSGGLLGVSIFFLLFSFVEYPWEIVTRPEKKQAAKKKVVRKKKKTAGS